MASFVREWRDGDPNVDSSREAQEKVEGFIMSDNNGAISVPDEQVRIASTKMDGIGPQKAMKFRYRLGISGNIKIQELTKYQIDQMEQMISQDHVVNWELKRGERAGHQTINFYFSLSWNSSSRWIALTRSTNSY
ncbi:hypothetical protein C4D60_Mb00t00080 [Musa balbisiana]|uniref:Uncharacterized protein n=1 Tax=Musa balbisiana TaxID=52838 RepID=A0A4S8I7I5_MUSBA|nr:hypothetical protein C4D60_Mb00t00080 [Musa balbisiana]